MPPSGTAASDTFETGTIAAAWGGITTIVDFAVQTTGASVVDGLATWHAKADGSVSAQERKRLTHAQNHASRSIHRQKHDGQTRK